MDEINVTRGGPATGCIRGQPESGHPFTGPDRCSEMLGPASATSDSGTRSRIERLNRDRELERVTGIEPVLEAWEATVIPFHHTRSGRQARIQRVARRCKRGVD